jgi:peptidoglycan hydrolase-like amidase
MIRRFQPGCTVPVSLQRILMLSGVTGAALAGAWWLGRSDIPFMKPGASASSARLLDLLQDPPPPAEARIKPAALSVTAKRPRTIPAIPEAQSPLQLPIRVALLSQVPIRSLKPMSGCRCSLPDRTELNTQQLNTMINAEQTGQFHCRGGRLMINDRVYGDDLHLINRGEGWMAVNELDLETYIASVVGGEMPAYWDMEALKAQAVAARSYAMAHFARPAASDYHLGDTTRWQVFLGDQSVSERTVRAARNTQGIILSYDGGIVESLYAANSTITAEAHGHLGASMSQTGAQKLASNGLKYSEILGSYYRGASLARLRIDGN